MELEIQDVSKTLKGHMVLNHVSMTAQSGRIYAIVGKNGSGKTMLFRAVAGLMRPDSGEICLDGKYLHKDYEVLPNLGIVLENAGLYPELSGYENLKGLAELKKKVSEKEIKLAITRVGLDPEDKRPVRKYSLGMKQRIVLAQAFMESPDVLLLDEPTNALDEEGVELMREEIKKERDRGAIILLASHNKEDIEALADEIYYMREGKLQKEAL